MFGEMQSTGRAYGAEEEGRRGRGGDGGGKGDRGRREEKEKKRPRKPPVPAPGPGHTALLHLCPARWCVPAVQGRPGRRLLMSADVTGSPCLSGCRRQRGAGLGGPAVGAELCTVSRRHCTHNVLPLMFPTTPLREARRAALARTAGPRFPQALGERTRERQGRAHTAPGPRLGRASPSSPSVCPACCPASSPGHTISDWTVSP